MLHKIFVAVKCKHIDPKIRYYHIRRLHNHKQQLFILIYNVYMEYMDIFSQISYTLFERT